MKDVYQELNEVAKKIERQWLRYNYASEDFYKVAWEQTSELDLSPLKDVSFQMRLLENEAAVRRNQHRSTFSDLHFQIYHNGRFLVEILNWAGSHVNVHDHDFSGVQFQLKGKSLNVVYDFETTERLGALRLGALSVRKSELWHEGGRSVVRHGDIDPHGVFHLSLPTTSLLFRTVATSRLGTQSNYFPTLAAHYTVNGDIQRKKLTALSLLAHHAPAEFVSMLETFLDTQSLSENFFMLLKLGEVTFREENLAVVDKFADRGERESEIIKNVIFNNGIEFFKSQATLRKDVTEDERLAVSVLAGTHGKDNLQRVLGHLKGTGATENFQSNIQSFMGKLTERDRQVAQNFLSVFGIEEVYHV